MWLFEENSHFMIHKGLWQSALSPHPEVECVFLFALRSASFKSHHCVSIDTNTLSLKDKLEIECRGKFGNWKKKYP